MKTNILNRLVNNFEKDIYWLGKQRIKECFEPYKTIPIMNNDPKEVRELIVKYNSKVKEFNKYGEALAILMIRKMDQFSPQPQDDFLWVVDEWLRLKTLKKDKHVFCTIHSQMHILDWKMYNLNKGIDGIEDLQKKINRSRKV